MHQLYRKLWIKAWLRLFCYVGSWTPTMFNDTENSQAHDAATETTDYAP